MNATAGPRPASRRRVAMRRPAWTASRGVAQQVAQRRGGRVQVGHEEGDSPEPRRTAGIGGELRALGRLDHLENHLAHPEERLAHRAARGGALAQAPEVESRAAQHLRGAVEVRRHHNDVIDRLDPVGMRPAGGRRPLGGDRAEVRRAPATKLPAATTRRSRAARHGPRTAAAPCRPPRRRPPLQSRPRARRPARRRSRARRFRVASQYGPLTRAYDAAPPAGSRQKSTHG